MAFTFRPAKRENTPLIIGIAGPTKSGKTFSAHRLAIGLAAGGQIAMINAEGPKGHQYVNRFTYMATEIEAPYRPERYTEALKAALAMKPAVVIIDSMSHMHDGPGGVLEYHEDELDRMVGKDFKARQRATFAAWVKPKAAENEFIYTMLGAGCHLILCFRAKEKIKIVPGKEPVDLGWQPIAGERIAFETIFTVMLPPHSKGVADLEISDMREPFDTMVPKGKPIDEDLGRELAKWATGGAKAPAASPMDPERATALQAVTEELVKQGLGGNTDDAKKRRGDALQAAFGIQRSALLESLPVEQLRAGLVKLQAPPPATTSGTAVVPSGSAPITVASAPAEQPGLALSTPATSTTATEATEERAPWDEDPSPIDGGRRDESTAKGLVSSIEAEVKKWPKVPPQAVLEVIWSGYLGGAKDLAKADPAVLTDILTDVRLYTKKDPGAMTKINGYARAARVAS